MNYNMDAINEHRLYIADLRAQLDAERNRRHEANETADWQLDQADALRRQLAERDATIIAFQTRVTELRHDLNMVIDQRNAANARIAELEASQAWVSVDDRLPEPLADVLVVYNDYCVRGWLSEKAVWYMGSIPIPVNHWMPLPPPPVTP